MDNVAGITFQGRRNIYRSLGYDRFITPQMYRSRFRRNCVAQRVVTAYPKATWRSGAEIVENDNPEQTVFEKAWEQMESRLNVWAVFHRADILAGLGRYSIILIGTPGDLDQPLEDGTLKAEDIVYLTPFMEEDAIIEKFDTDTKSPRFGMPVYYSVRRLAPNAFRVNTPETVGRRVHYSRVIHVADGILDDHVYGIPRLEKMWNILDDLEKVTGGGAEAFWKRADQGLILNLDRMLTLRKDAATGKFLEIEQMREQIEAYEHDLKRVLLMRGVTVEKLGSDVADIGPTVASLMSQIAVGSEIPQRILMGSEAAKLASTQDDDNWDERVADRRSEYAAPQIVKPFVERLIRLGALPKPQTGSFMVRWPEIKNLTEAQRADLAVKWSTINKNAGGVVVQPADIREKVLGLDPVSPARGTGEGVPTKVSNPGESQSTFMPKTPAYGYDGGKAVYPYGAKGRTRWSASRKEGSTSWIHIHDTADRFRPES